MTSSCKEWDGVERRCSLTSKGSSTEFCPTHIEMVTDVATIKNSLRNIEAGIGSRDSLYGAIIAIAITLITQIIAFAFLYGGLAKQVEINTHKWELLDQKYGHNLSDDRMHKL